MHSSATKSCWWGCYLLLMLLSLDGRKTMMVDPSPVWIPDSEAPVCMHCFKSEFNVINRRVSSSACFALGIISVSDVIVDGRLLRWLVRAFREQTRICVMQWHWIAIRAYSFIRRIYKVSLQNVYSGHSWPKPPGGKEEETLGWGDHLSHNP